MGKGEGMIKRKEGLDISNARHFFMVLHEAVGYIAEDRPRDNDALFAWRGFCSCVAVLNAIDYVNPHVVQIVLRLRSPNVDDHDSPVKYLREVYQICEEVLNKIGWPQDIGEIADEHYYGGNGGCVYGDTDRKD